MIPKVLLFIMFYCMFLKDEGFKISNYFKDVQAVLENADTYLTPPKIIRKYGYPAEAHIIQSADGYLLEYHRISHGKIRSVSKNKPYPILLHHGLLCSSLDWIINGPEKSLAYRLADDGYDVWMANARGNTFSRSHTSMSPKEKAFWNFTFHEMGMYDLPAAVDHILHTTNKDKIVFIGHSLGTTTFYAFAATRPDYNNKIFFHISLAPVAGLGHTTSAFRLLVPYAKKIESLSDWYSKGAFLEHDLLTSLICKLICGKNMFNYNICEQLVIFRLFGKDSVQFNQNLLPLVYSNLPAGTSGKNMIHCAQMISSGNFSYYDYGTAENIQMYHTSKPPIYNLSSVTIPMRFYYGKNDILADPLDVELLYQKISKPMGLVLVDYEKWNHVDFLWAIDINKYLNEQLLEFLKNSTTDPEFIETVIQDALDQRTVNKKPVDVIFDKEHFSAKFNELPELQILQILRNYLANIIKKKQNM